MPFHGTDKTCHHEISKYHTFCRISCHLDNDSPTIILQCSFSHRFLQTIVNCKEMVGPLKIWELFREWEGRQQQYPDWFSGIGTKLTFYNIRKLDI